MGYSVLGLHLVPIHSLQDAAGWELGPKCQKLGGQASSAGRSSVLGSKPPDSRPGQKISIFPKSVKARAVCPLSQLISILEG